MEAQNSGSPTMETGLVFNLQKYSIHDGPGIRTTVFFKGCSLRCWWCHNPESQSFLPEILINNNRCIECAGPGQPCPRGPVGPVVLNGTDHGVDGCPTGARQLVGRLMSVADVMKEVLKDRMFYEESGGGVTFSGGEPLMQPAFLKECLAACRAEEIHTALDTCGFGPQEQLLAAAALADLVLYDLKVMDDERHQLYTGVSNKGILDNLRALSRHHNNIWIRIPIIPGLTDQPRDLEAAIQFVRTIPGVKKVNLLPYHKTGAYKFLRLGRSYNLEGVESPTAQRMEELAQGFRAGGLDVKIGG